jgi:hypothetical protein
MRMLSECVAAGLLMGVMLAVPRPVRSACLVAQSNREAPAESAAGGIVDGPRYICDPVPRRVEDKMLLSRPAC